MNLMQLQGVDVGGNDLEELYFVEMNSENLF